MNMCSFPAKVCAEITDYRPYDACLCAADMYTFSLFKIFMLSLLSDHACLFRSRPGHTNSDLGCIPTWPSNDVSGDPSEWRGVPQCSGNVQWIAASHTGTVGHSGVPDSQCQGLLDF